ncbi:hypothetical protein [uncultured Jatrophihabitans sp.]|uniref:hypothetical protein n=1 Tax=uncultured Jatrophihabitans sp. TaxID=1610747 RepID=UPI0035CAB312
MTAAALTEVDDDALDDGAGAEDVGLAAVDAEPEPLVPEQPATAVAPTMSRTPAAARTVFVMPQP